MILLTNSRYNSVLLAFFVDSSYVIFTSDWQELIIAVAI